MNSNRPTKVFILIVIICIGTVCYYSVSERVDEKDFANILSHSHDAVVKDGERRALINTILFMQVGLGLSLILVPFIIVMFKNRAVWQRLQQRKQFFSQREDEQKIIHRYITQAPTIHPDQQFSIRLLQSHPDLTPYDIKLCTLLWKNYSSKQVAEALNITPGSVNTARYRLRKKIALPNESDLIIYLKGLT